MNLRRVLDGLLQVWLVDLRVGSTTLGNKRRYLLSAEEPGLLFIRWRGARLPCGPPAPRCSMRSTCNSICKTRTRAACPGIISAHRCGRRQGMNQDRVSDLPLIPSNINPKS